MSLVAATVWNATGTITFNSTTTGNTITTNAVVISCATTFDGVGGSWQLQNALTSGATRTCTLTNGTLDLASYTLTTGLFSSASSNTRVLAFGTGKIVLTGSNVTVWSNSTGTGFTYTGTSRIESPGPATSGIRTFNPSSNGTSTQAIALNFYITGGSDLVTFTTSSRRVNNIDFTGFTGAFRCSNLTVHGNYTLAASPMVVQAGTEITFFAATTSQNITTNSQTLDFPVTFSGVGGTFVMQDALTLGATQPLTMTNGTLKLKAGTTSTVGSFVTTGTTLKYLQSTTPGTQATISDASGTDSVTYLSVQDSNATGGATWNATDPTNVYVTNNTGWNFGTLAALSGVVATGAVGSLAFNFNFAVTGVQATGAVGSVGFANAYALSSVLSTTDVGSVAPRFTVATTGVQATGAAGSVVWGNAYALSGVQATGSVGSFSLTSTISMSGVLATGSVETIFGFGWGAIPDTSESWGAIPDTSESWGAIPDTSESWGAIPDTSETWTAIANTSETWTPISSTS
jgi:hypothetical protein